MIPSSRVCVCVCAADVITFPSGCHVPLIVFPFSCTEPGKPVCVCMRRQAGMRSDGDNDSLTMDGMGE